MHIKINITIPILHDIEIKTFLITNGLKIHPKRKLIHPKTLVQFNVYRNFLSYEENYFEISFRQNDS